VDAACALDYTDLCCLAIAESCASLLPRYLAPHVCRDLRYAM